MLSDPIADLLVRIKNAQMVKKRIVSVPFSKQKQAIVDIFIKQGYLKASKIKGKLPQEKTLVLNLKYPQNRPAISSLTRISKPGVRIYVATKEIYKLLRGRGLVIISTSKGLMTAAKAKKSNLGGEVICKVN